MGVFGNDSLTGVMKPIGMGPGGQFPVTGQGGDSAMFNASNAAAMKDTTGLDAATNPWNDPNSAWNKGTASPFDPKNDPNSNVNKPYQHSILSAPAVYGQSAPNMALKAPAQAGVTTPSNLVWTTGTDEHGQPYGKWVDKSTAPTSGAGSPNFNTNGNDSTAAGSAARAASSVPTITSPTNVAPPVAQVSTNDPYVQGTQAFTDRKSLMDDAITKNYNGAERATMDQIAQMGMGGTGLGAALMASNNQRAGEAHSNLTADLSSNDPIRNMSYLKDYQGLVSADQINKRYGAETPGYLARQGLENTGLELSNAAASQKYDVVQQKLPMELEQMKLGNTKATADIQAFAQELPLHLQEMQSASMLTASQAQQAQFIAQNQGALAAMSFIAQIIGGVSKVAGSIIGLGATRAKPAGTTGVDSTGMA